MLSCVYAGLRLGVKAQLAGVPIPRNNWYRNGRDERNYKVTVVGAGGGIGQPLSLLLKQNPLIHQLTLHDLSKTKGVAADLSHICTPTQVDFFEGVQQQALIDALQDSHVVVVSAGQPRKPGMTRGELLSTNAAVAMAVSCAAGISCPQALLAFITNPINMLVPIAAEFLKVKGVYDPKRLFGITTLDVVRAKTFIADFMNLNPAMVDIPIIGGHSGDTILPVFSHCSPQFTGNEEDVERLTNRIQQAGNEVIEAKAGQGSATHSMAFASARFVNALLRGLNNEANVIECAYVDSDVTELPFFATPVLLGPNGIKENLGLPELNLAEQDALERMLPELGESIKSAIQFAQTVIKDSNLEQEQEQHKADAIGRSSDSTQLAQNN